MNLKDVLIKNDFHFNKKFGQNFISDKNLLSSIVEKAGVCGSDTVVEVGCGGGTLTSAIADRAKRVIGFEIDQNLRPVLRETLAAHDNVEIIYKDIMSMSAREIDELVGEKYSVVANLPYYITTPVLMKFVEECQNVERITVTIQKEVADRLVAKAGTPEYGAITAAIDVVGNAVKVADIHRSMFYPIPNVDSAVVRIDIDKSKYDVENIKAYRQAVKCAFQSRRKTLSNNIMLTFGATRQTSEEVLNLANINLTARGETLDTEQFISLSKALLVKGVIK